MAVIRLLIVEMFTVSTGSALFLCYFSILALTLIELNFKTFTYMALSFEAIRQ